MRVIAGGRNDKVGGIVAAVAVVGVLAVLIIEPARSAIDGMGPMTITVATMVAAFCGAVLAVVMTFLSGSGS